MIYGSDNRKIIPASICLGAAFMVVIDTAARAATAAEIPVSILTAIIGRLSLSSCCERRRCEAVKFQVEHGVFGYERIPF